MEIKIYYGVLSDGIESQLNSYGLTLGDKEEFIDKLCKSLIMCHFHVLTDSQYDIALKKLNKKVMRYAKPLDGNN